MPIDFSHKTTNNAISFINMYTEENRMFQLGEECYFIFQNVVDYHIPLIGKGIIHQDKFTTSINKQYYIELIDLYDDEKVLEKYFYPSQISLYNAEDLLRIPKYSKFFTLGYDWKTDFMKTNLFKIECFFVRDTLEKIVALRSEYSLIIEEDLRKQIEEVKFLTI